MRADGKIIISAKMNCAITIILVAFLLGGIHWNVDALLHYFNTKMHPLFQILLFCGLLAFAGILIGISKTREAGFSGQYTEKKLYSWKPATLEFSVKEGLFLLSYLFQVVIFSISFYVFLVFAKYWLTMHFS